MQTSFSKRNYGLDIIRSLAILFVVVSHCTYLLAVNPDHPIILILRILGAIGVDLFFLLSGFLIGGILLKLIKNEQTNFSNLFIFWKRRWFRTLPNYFLILIINICIALIFQQYLPQNILLFFPFLQNFYFPQVNFFTESWSLSIEEYAYLILPFVFYTLFVLFKDLKPKKIFLWGTIGVILILLFFKLKFYVEHPVTSYMEWSVSFRKVVIYRLDSIYMGFLLIYLVRDFGAVIKKIKNILALVGLFLFAFIHYLIYKFQILPQSHLWFYVFLYLGVITLSCSLVFPYAIHIKKSKRFSKLFYFLSTRSYAIYLVNYSVILLNLERSFDIISMNLIEKITIIICYLGLTLVIANSVYTYFEKPILNYRNRNYNNY
jgi:peptidoglycan/LPS O-acetylase OafA/YrhL